MLISELETSLREIRNSVGDVPVYCDDSAPGLPPHCYQCKGVTVNPDMGHGSFAVLRPFAASLPRFVESEGNHRPQDQ